MPDQLPDPAFRLRLRALARATPTSRTPCAMRPDPNDAGAPRPITAGDLIDALAEAEAQIEIWEDVCRVQASVLSVALAKPHAPHTTSPSLLAHVARTPTLDARVVPTWRAWWPFTRGAR